jgi:hypothetical protein
MGLIPKRKTERIVPPFNELTMLVYGIQGSGKTTFCNGDHNSITVATEPGAEYVDTRAIPTHSWETFLKVINETYEELKSDRTFCSGVVVDTVDILAEQCRDDVCAQLGISYPGEKKDYGKSWSDVSKEWRRAMTSLLKFSNVRFISHMKETTIEVANEHGLLEEVTKHIPRFSSGQPADFLDGVVRMVGYMYANKKGQYCITFKPNAYRCAKDRTGILRDIEEIVLPDDPEKGFDYVSELYAERAKEQGFTIKSRRER